MNSHGQTPRKRLRFAQLLMVGGFAVLGHAAIAQAPGNPPPGQQPPAGQPPAGQPPAGQPPARQQPPAGQPQGPMGQSAQMPDFDDETVEKFAKAWSEVQDIRDDYLGQIEAADNAETAQALQSEAQEAMVEAVTEAGVQVSEYNRIASAMGQDPELAQRIEEMAGSG